MTWTITANGHTEKVIAKLVPAYEKDERFIETNNSTGMVFGEEDLNKAPSLTVAATISESGNEVVSLSALVADDGLPKPRPTPVPRPATPPTEQSRFQSQRNNSSPRPQLTGTRVVWMQYRGPAKVNFDATTIQVVDGKAVTTARFTAPGTYTLFATANDTKLYTRKEIVVTVK